MSTAFKQARRNCVYGPGFNMDKYGTCLLLKTNNEQFILKHKYSVIVGQHIQEK